MGHAYYSDADNVQQFFDRFQSEAETIQNTMAVSIGKVTTTNGQCTESIRHIASSAESMVAWIAEIMDSSTENTENFKELTQETERFV